MRALAIVALLCVLLGAASVPAAAQTGATPTPTPGGPNDPGTPATITQTYHTIADGAIYVPGRSLYAFQLPQQYDVIDLSCASSGYNAAIFWRFGSGSIDGLLCTGAQAATKVLRNETHNLSIWLSMESSDGGAAFTVLLRGWNHRTISLYGYQYTQSTLFNAYVELLPAQTFTVRVETPSAQMTMINGPGVLACTPVARYTTIDGLQYDGWGFCGSTQEQQAFTPAGAEAGGRIENTDITYRANLTPGHNPDPLFRLDGQGFPPTPSPTTGSRLDPIVSPTPPNCKDAYVPDGQTTRVIQDWITQLYGTASGPVQQFYVTAPAGVIHYGAVQVPATNPPMVFDGLSMGGVHWRFDYAFAAENFVMDSGVRVGINSVLRVCVPPSQLYTPTATRTPTSSPTPGISPTSGSLPIGTPLPTPPVTPIIPPTQQAGTMPDLGLMIPTFAPLATITATISISTTVLTSTISTAQAGIATPLAAFQTAVAPYDWTTGRATSQQWIVTMQPALDWIPIVNPLNPAWTATGGLLWSLAPLLLPIMPLIAIGLVIVFIRFFMWLLG